MTSHPGKGKGKAMAWVQAHVAHEGTECLRWPFSLGDGYPTLGHDGRHQRGHRLMCKLAHGEPPTPRHQAAHECGNSWCINPRHLSWKTNGANQLDRRQHGTKIKKGGKRVKLTPEQVAEINASTLSHAKLGTLYGVCKATIWHIKNGKTWKGGVAAPPGFKAGDPRNTLRKYAA
jgi:hypothetical protein